MERYTFDKIKKRIIVSHEIDADEVQRKIKTLTLRRDDIDAEIERLKKVVEEAK